MDQQNFYYGKHNAGSLNYQTAFGNSGSEYQATDIGEHTSLHHSTSLNFNSSSTATNNVCSDLSNTPSTVANLSRSTNNNLTANPSTNEYNAGSYSRFYSYISDNTVQNVSSASSNTSDCNNTKHVSAFSSKSYENTTNSAHVPVIAVTSNSSHARAYHSNINYGSYSADYHKTLNQNYPSGSIIPSPTAQNRTSLNSATAFTPVEHIVQPTVKRVSNNVNNNGKISAKTSVIKPVNAYNATASVSSNSPINYAKYVQPYPIYANNNKTVSTLEKSPSSANRGMYLNSSTNHKNTELYCPEPISAARYSNPAYAINVSTPGSGHTNSHYLSANSYPLNYGHHPHYLTQHQNSVSHHRNFLPTPAYQASLDESVASNYLNRQNVVRPTPSNTYKQGQITYQNPYSYARGNIVNAASGVSTNHSNNNHPTLPKPQTQNPLEDSYSLAHDFDNAYDRRNFRQYNSMYSSNYIDSTGFEEYTQYSFPSAHSSSVPFYSPKASSKQLLYNHNPGLNVYNNNATAHVQLTSQTSQSVSTSDVATTSTTTVVQQPVPINPSSSQLISSNYDATSMHGNSILPSSLFNNNNKELCQPSNQYHHQQSPYTSQILYSRLQNGNYYPSMKSNQSAHLGMHSNDVHIVQDKVCSEKPLQAQPNKYSVIDLEEQINSSKISKVSGTMLSNSTLHHRVNEFGQKIPVVHIQGDQRQPKDNGSSQNAIESNKNSYVYNSESSYNTDCYRLQYQWKKSVSSSSSTATSTSSSLSSTTTHMHPKKQSIRDYLSTWNEDEDGEIDATSKKASNNQNLYLAAREPPHLINSMMRLEKSNRINENVPVIVQPVLQPPHSNLYSSMAIPCPGVSILNNASTVPPKFQVGICIDNESQNLPDIIVDIPKPKGDDEAESFERANVIQEVPKSSEKLYILDSIEVPLSDLNKYRHLSVVNRLPDNIVLPPPPLSSTNQCHEHNVPNVNVPVKIVGEQHLIHKPQLTKDEFGERDANDKDVPQDILTETRNTLIVKKLLKKYRKRDQMRNKQKQALACQQAPSNEHNSDLSTPLRSLSPAHDFDSEMTRAVDLSVHSKEMTDDLSVNSNDNINEFIGEFSMCTDDGEYDLIPSPLAEILKLTEHQPLEVNSKNDSDCEMAKKHIAGTDKVSDHECTDNVKDVKNDEGIGNVGNVIDSKIVEPIEIIEIEEENEQEKESIKKEETKQEETKKEAEKQENGDDNIPPKSDTYADISIDTLQNYCVKTFNTREFRSYFKENVINTTENDEISPDCSTTKNESEEPKHTHSNKVVDSKDDIIVIDTDDDENDDEIPELVEVCTKNPNLLLSIPSLCALAKQAVRLNQLNMSSNLKPIVKELESKRKIVALDIVHDTCANKVPTLQELAREVANTIYSFNVKPLQDICKLAIEKFNHLYMVSQLDTPSTGYISEMNVTEKINETFVEASSVDKLPQIEEQSVIQRANSNGTQSSLNMTEIMDYSSTESPVKSLKNLAQICVDDLKKCNETENQTKNTNIKSDIITCNSSDSETDTSSIRSSQKGVITGGARKVSSSESQSSSESESSSDSSDSDDSDDDETDENDNSDFNKTNNDTKQITDQVNEFTESIKSSIKQQIVDDWSSESSSCDEIVVNSMVNKIVEQNENNDSSPIAENVANQMEEVEKMNEVEIYNPTALKDICKEVLNAHSMIIQYEVPTLKCLCEHTLATAGMEIPLICFVPEEEFMTEDQSSNDDDGVYLCLDGEFDERELANLFNGDSIDMHTLETKECATDNSSFRDQCVALQNILSSPLPEDNQLNESIEIQSDEFYVDPNGFYDSIQYEETVLQSENQEDSAAAIAKLKKYLQNKYVHPFSYHKMFAINKLLRKYKVYQVSFCNKKSSVQEKVQKKLSKLRQQAEQRCKPKKLATRRSARIADKIKQKIDETDYIGKKSKSTKNENTKVDSLERRHVCKIVNVNELIQNSGKKRKITETDKESITRDLLKLIAKKRTLKRKLSICQRPKFTLDDDGYCYDEDGQISEMLSSFINNSIDEERSELSNVKKPRSRKPSIESKSSKEHGIKKKTVPPITLKKQFITEYKGKAKKPKSKTKNSIKGITNEPKEKPLALTETFAVNKTEKKRISPGTTLTFPTKASVKEIIPAKRTRFLSIDSSLMRYGTESKRSYNQMKSLKENSESLEIVKRKVTTPKLLKSNNIDVATMNKDAQKSTRIKEKPVTLPECKKSNPEVLKEILKSSLKCVQSEKIQNNTIKYKIPTKVKVHNEVNEIQTTKQMENVKESHAEVLPEISTTNMKTLEEPIPKNAKENNRLPKRTRFSDRIQSLSQDQSPYLNETKVEKDQSNFKAADSTENVMDNNKFSIKNQEKPLSERSLCSTMVSPLKIIIEPKRFQSPSPPKNEYASVKDPLAINKTNEELGPQNADSTTIKPIVEKKEVQRKTRFSDRITNSVVKPLVIGSENTQSPSIQIEPSMPLISENNDKKSPEKNVIRPNRETDIRESTPTQEQQILFTKPDMNATIKPLIDIEQLLPSTKILQPKPGRRCLARAQTISHSVSPLNNNNTYEPMQLRSSNSYWSRRRFDQPRNYDIKQYQRNFPYKPKEFPSALYKEKLTSTTNSNSPPKTMVYSQMAINNTSKNIPPPLQKKPIDISSFPDPETLQIPSLDLRMSPFGRSPLTLSIPKPMAMQDNKEIATASNSEPKRTELNKFVSDYSKFDIPPSDPRQTSTDVERKSPAFATNHSTSTPFSSPSNTSPKIPISIQKSIPSNILSNVLKSFSPNNFSPKSLSPSISLNLPSTPVLSSPSNSVLSRVNLPSSNKSPLINIQSLNIPSPNVPSSGNVTPNISAPSEMNTIPLELDRVVTQQRKIREMQRRNSLCVAEISSYQRNILSKFANSIKHKKLKVEDILKKIYNKQPSPSSTSSSSSDSDSSNSNSSESVSSSSSSSCSSKKKSRRYHKKKRSHKRNSNSDDSSTESSSSSSSSSSSTRHGIKRSKRYRKSTRKSTNQINDSRRKPTPKPMFDIETIKQNALMGCVMHEELLRNKLNQMSSYSSIAPNESSCAQAYMQQSQNTSILSSDAPLDMGHTIKNPYVKLQRNTNIENMAENYAHEQQQNTNNNNTSTRYKQKRFE
ncbi:uncharacterized protein LOC116338335 [Contarinia nasturtii]|uniref:uncharacterized protein LOC116338335 n=1 Tax=Contarinia nasturtii TaxID=265458 RepID=UPI0012D47C77|nr:uncharacterized protein LOC116338335 [Contarinia nasturtii]XP_031619367.1 uncharacterized protein LOC116338335 [Contarinia nasturtii]